MKTLLLRPVTQRGKGQLPTIGDALAIGRRELTANKSFEYARPPGVPDACLAGAAQFNR